MRLCLFFRMLPRTRASLRRELFLPVREQTAGGVWQNLDGQYPCQARPERQGQYSCVVTCLSPDEAPQGRPKCHAYPIPDVLPAVQAPHGGVAIVLTANHGENRHLSPHTNAKEDSKEKECPGILRKEEEEYRKSLHAETARHDFFAADVVRHHRHRKPCEETTGIESSIDTGGQTRCEATCHGDRRQKQQEAVVAHTPPEVDANQVPECPGA